MTERKERETERKEGETERKVGETGNFFLVIFTFLTGLFHIQLSAKDF